MEEELTCNDCKYYDVCDGICSKDNENHYGYEDACEKFKQETDTQLTEAELQGDK